MEEINFDYTAYQKGFNQGFEMLELAPEIYASIIQITNAPKAYVEGLKDARKEFEKTVDRSEISKGRDQSLER